MKKFYEAGQQIETQIVAINGDTVFLDLGLKSEGILDAADVRDKDGNLTVKEGDRIKVYFVEEKNGELHFAAKLSGDKADKSILEKAYQGGIPLEGHVEKEIKGGFEVTIGNSRCFCPYSQMGYKQKLEPSDYIGKHLTFKITEYKNEGKNIIVSNRILLEEEENEKLSSLSQKITEGTKIKGKVVSIQNYGAFIDIGGFQALLPAGEISHARVNNIEDFLKIGQEVEVLVIKADWQNEKISVSMKALEKDPWDEAEKKFKPGSKIDGSISRIADFGLFINLEPGIDGLIHISQLEGVERNSNLKKLYKVGSPFSVVVEKVDAKEKRISLKPASSVEQDDDTAKYLADQDNDDSDTYNPFKALLKR